MNAFDLSPAQIRNRLILRARQAALATRTWSPNERRYRVELVPGAVRRPLVTPRVSVAPGDVVQLGEADYRYAEGPLRLRVARVRLDLSRWYDGQWVWLEGVEITSNGGDGKWRPVLVRVAALAGSNRIHRTGSMHLRC